MDSQLTSTQLPTDWCDARLVLVSSLPNAISQSAEVGQFDEIGDSHVSQNSIGIEDEANVEVLAFEGPVEDPDVAEEIIIESQDMSVQSSEDSDRDNVSKPQTGTRKRKRNTRRKICEGKKALNKIKRMKGQAYVGFQVSVVPSNSQSIVVKQTQDKDREARKLGEACNSKKCENSSVFQCRKLTEAKRQELFQNFWENMTWEQRQTYVAALVDYIQVKGNTTGRPSRRSGTYVYHLKFSGSDDQERRLRVCRGTFLSTFNLAKGQVQSWAKTASAGIHTPSISNSSTKKRSKSTPDRVAEQITTFLDSLPKLPSHYRRSQSSKEYLEPIFNSKLHLYEVYVENCKELDVIPASRFKFCAIFNQMNISLFQPKNDQCDTCCAYKVKNISKDEWDSHVRKKDAARAEKTKDKQRAIEEDCHTLTMDVQSVKVAPCLKASALYYKTKLCVHNYTIYDLATNHATCYWWNEAEGELVASTFASCLIDFLKINFQDTLDIVIFSDGCTAQNRNAIMSNALLHYAMESKKTIYQKYLEKGHTQMECDSVHSTIEAKLKNREIHLPSDYATVCSEARRKPAPYSVKYLSYDFFTDYSKPTSMVYGSIRPGKGVGDPTVTDLRAIKYDPSGVIYYKLNFDDDWTLLPKRPQKKTRDSFPPLYSQMLPISQRKWNDLQDLKHVLPSDCHSFYDSLPK